MKEEGHNRGRAAATLVYECKIGDYISPCTFHNCLRIAGVKLQTNDGVLAERIYRTTETSNIVLVHV